MAQAYKALFALNYKIQNVNIVFFIPIDLQLKLFDCLITPVLLYSSEIWSYENIEVTHTKMKSGMPMGSPCTVHGLPTEAVGSLVDRSFQLFM